jgi:hypothetical protein
MGFAVNRRLGAADDPYRKACPPGGAEIGRSPREPYPRAFCLSPGRTRLSKFVPGGGYR